MASGVELSAPAISFETTYDAPTCAVRGEVRSARFHPAGYSLWRVTGELAMGTELEWGTEHGDEVIYVVTGAIDVAGTHAREGAAVIVEAGVATVVRAHTETVIVHFGPATTEPPTGGMLGPAAADGHTVHVISAGDAEQVRRATEVSGGSLYYADGDCPTCRAVIFLVDWRAAIDGLVTPSHRHSEDELIHVLDGELQVGRETVGPGMTMAVPGGLRYGFRSSGPYRFLNYRADVSTFTMGPPSNELVITETLSEMRRVFAEAARDPDSAAGRILRGPPTGDGP